MNAATAIASLPDGEGLVEVVGTGALADEVRRLLLRERVRLPRADERPTAIIETTGKPAALETALQRVDDLGTVVLAGPLPTRPLALDLYADLHVRGLTLVGVSRTMPESGHGR
jgi:threonine dehydrogenase-like Zn-dependent dehydrogenase